MDAEAGRLRGSQGVHEGQESAVRNSWSSMPIRCLHRSRQGAPGHRSTAAARMGRLSHQAGAEKPPFCTRSLGASHVQVDLVIPPGRLPSWAASGEQAGIVTAT